MSVSHALKKVVVLPQGTDFLCLYWYLPTTAGQPAFCHLQHSHFWPLNPVRGQGRARELLFHACSAFILIILLAVITVE